MPRKFLRSLRRRRRSRRRSSKKKTTNRQKSKKMRGGVTVRAQDLKTRLPEDMFREIREMHPLDGKSQNRNDCLDFFLSVARLRLGLGPSKG